MTFAEWARSANLPTTEFDDDDAGDEIYRIAAAEWSSDVAFFRRRMGMSSNQCRYVFGTCARRLVMGQSFYWDDWYGIPKVVHGLSSLWARKRIMRDLSRGEKLSLPEFRSRAEAYVLEFALWMFGESDVQDFDPGKEWLPATVKDGLSALGDPKGGADDNQD